MINGKYERKQTRIVPETFFKINMKTKSLKLIFKNIFEFFAFKISVHAT